MSPQHERFDAVVIGSGFGGSIAALRLAQAGRSVLLLERGRRYRPGEFPRDITQVEQIFWRHPEKRTWRGLYDVRVFSGIGVVVAAGLGGGSLIYANIHVRPDPGVFEDPRWPSSIRRDRLEPYYDKVAAMLEVAPVPADIQLKKRDVFRKAAAQLNRPVFDPDQAVRWSGPQDGDRGPCQLVTECEFGCQFGAKNTLDLTYLAEAARLGAQIRTDSLVTHIEPDPAGYTVHCRGTDDDRRTSATGTRVVLAAGTLGTNEILFRSRDVTRTLPAISARLGIGYSGNGDFLGSIQNAREDLEPWRGPDVTSVIKYAHPSAPFTLAAPTFNRRVMEVLASMPQMSGPGLRLLAPSWTMLGDLLPRAFDAGVMRQPIALPGLNAGDPARLTNLFAIGRDNANGRISFDGNRLDIEWKYAEENRDLVDRMQAAMREIADVYGGTYAPLLTWEIFRRILTVHSLGGCHLSDSPSTGVVSPRGEVHGYPGLFVADGSVIPTAIGFHPCMTISAVAEYIAEGVVETYTTPAGVGH